jgi:hypothetical protein
MVKELGIVLPADPQSVSPVSPAESLVQPVPPVPPVPPAELPVPPVPPAEPPEEPPVPPEQEPDNRQYVSITDENGQAHEYVLDDNGNAVDENGNVVYTKEQLADDDGYSAIDTAQLIEDVGIVPLDDNGEPLSVPNTAEGIATYAKRIAEQEYGRGVKEFQDSFYAQNPDIAEMMKYKNIYGTLDGFGKNINYNKLQINAGDEAQQISIIKQARQMKGDTDSEIERLLKYSKLDNTLKKDAEDSLEYLKAQQNAIESKAMAERKQKEIAAAKAEIDYWGVKVDKNGQLQPLNVTDSVYDKVVMQGKIGDLTIPKTGIKYQTPDGKTAIASRMDIFDYLYKPVQEDKSGRLYSQAEIDEMNKSNDTNYVLFRFLQNKFGSNLEEFVKSAVAQQHAKSIKNMRVKPSVTKTPTNSQTTGGTVILPF